MSHAKLLTIAGVPPDLRGQALDALTLAQGRSRGLFAAKLKTRLLKAGRIAKAMPWEAERLIEVRPDWADDDIAPMLNITGHGDNGPWHEAPEGGRPVVGYWLNPDPQSDEYREAVAKCYWCPGHHPRSDKARKAWYRRNGGEYRAWRLGQSVDPSLPVQRWQGQDDRLSVSVVRCGDAWIVNTERKYGPLVLRGRYGFEVDNVFSGQYSPQMWFPIPGYELRAPVTWSTVPRWGD